MRRTKVSKLEEKTADPAETTELQPADPAETTDLRSGQWRLVVP